MNIKAIKLINGEEFVCSITELENNEIKCFQPHILLPAGQDSENPGQASFFFKHFLLYSDDESIILNKNHIFCITEPSNFIRRAWEQQYSPIIMPNKKDLIV